MTDEQHRCAKCGTIGPWDVVLLYPPMTFGRICTPCREKRT